MTVQRSSKRGERGEGSGVDGSVRHKQAIVVHQWASDLIKAQGDPGEESSVSVQCALVMWGSVREGKAGLRRGGKHPPTASHGDERAPGNRAEGITATQVAGVVVESSAPGWWL